jgi:hypothetical protein
VRRAYAWVYRAARILKNADNLSEAAVRRRLRGLLGAMARHRKKAGRLEGAVGHFLKVTRSYWPGLFPCYRIADLPRTNNALEQLFGSNRFHERRATGRKTASPALVLRGSVRLLAATATRLRPRSAAELQPRNPEQWRALRQQLEARRQVRRCGLRFRRNPDAYLQPLQALLLKLILPT